MVALFLRPDADISDGGWTDEGGATTLFDAVDESSFSDTDYIKSSSAVGDKVSLRLSDPTGTPTEPMTIRVRCKREGTDATDLIARLYEATSPPTLICYFEIPTLTTSFATYEHELPAAEFAAIGDFNNLYIEFESNPTASHHGARIDLNFAGADYFDSLTPTVPADVTDYLSCSRASIGYAKTAAGTLTQFGNNTLRITNLGLLVEDARTNLLLRSQELATNWIAENISSITSDATAAPDGTTTADKLIPNTTANAFHDVYQSISVGGSVDVSYSCYAKAAGYNYAAIIAVDQANNRYTINVDLTTGTITSTNSIGTPVVVSSSTESLADGWCRLSVTLTNATAGTVYISLCPSNASSPSYDVNNGGPTFTGDGSSGVYFWGAQIEEASFPSSYIPTTTVAATRAADDIPTTGTLQTLLNGGAASIVVDSIYPSGVDTYKYLVGAAAAASDFSMISAGPTDYTVSAYSGTGDAIQATLGNSRLWSIGAKSCFAWDGSGRSIGGGGGTIVADAQGSQGKAATAIGRGGSFVYWHGYVRHLTVWNSRLSDTTLQTLTAP